MITLDIETHPIEFGKPCLPTPVGVAIRWSGGDRNYLAFGHPTGNNCTEDEAKGILLSIWNGNEKILTHNGANFDIPILTNYFNLPKLNPLRVEDTLFLAYLDNPHAKSLSLKDLAKNLLGIPADEQQKLVDWIVKNTECSSRKKAGEYIAVAPGELVGEYAMADVEMTFQLYELLRDKVLPHMEEPYHRELRLAPVLVDMQLRGVRCDLDALIEDCSKATKELHNLDWWVRESLSAPSLSIDSNEELVAALKGKGYSNFMMTPTGKESASKASLDKALETDPELKAKLKLRGQLATLTSTFMVPWIEIATENGGRIHASYNQVRNPDGFGTRTGRLSSSNPNFQNVPKDLGDGLPVMRRYLLPEPGHVWVCGDFKSQEPRLTAHFEDGALCAQFKADPTMDQYLWVAEVAGCSRKEAKVIFLGLVYAMGAETLAAGLGCDAAEATRIRNMVKAALPDVVQLDYDCKKRFRMGLPIKTLGGRQYHCEPPSNGRSWEYKALNTLIQGSAADQTKEALIYVAERLRPDERILGTVHDEISVSCPPERVEEVKALMNEAANVLACDVTMLMDINVGSNWAEAK